MSDMAYKWEIALYIELPKEERRGAGISAAAQIERLYEYLSGFEDDYEVADIYLDDVFSEADARREGFQQILSDIRRHKINCVAVTNLSGLSLSAKDEDFFVSYEIRVISLGIPILDSYKRPEQMERVFMPDQDIYNNEHRRLTSVKTRGALHKKRETGKFIGAFAPYGYIKDPEDKNHLVVDENAAPVVRNIFKWFSEDGMSKNAIAHKLNGLGILSPAAYKRSKGLKYAIHNNQFVAMWVPKVVRDILKNQMYLGHMVQGRYRRKSYEEHTRLFTPEDEWYIVKDTHTPIVSQEIFDLAQRRNEKKSQPPERKNVHIFAGVLKCYDCKHAMLLRSGENARGEKTYFQCRTYREKSREVCTRHMIRAKKLEENVLQAIKEHIMLAWSFKAIIEEIGKSSKIRNEIQRLNAALSDKEKEIIKAASDRVTLYMDWRTGVLDKDDYLELKAEYDNQIKHLKSTAETLRNERQTVSGGLDSANSYLNIILKYEAISELSREAVTNLLDTVYVHENGETEIIFAYAEQHKFVLDFIQRFQ